MKISLIVLQSLIWLLPFAAVSQAQPAMTDMKRVTIDAPAIDGWVGQRMSFYVELRAPGSFAGTVDFSIPQIPQTVIVKIANPVVSSRTIEDKTWFVQRHEFALFSQHEGVLEIPEFEVRYGNRDGFTGPVEDHAEMVPKLKMVIKSPPHRSDQGFLVTTEHLEITESWEPPPGSAKVGDVYRRVITQRADQVTGMALAPPPESDLDGIRGYWDKPEVADQVDRGAFSGIRIDRLTYLLQKPGRLTVPAIKYIWWDPKAETYGSTTLPAVVFDVAAPPPPKTGEEPRRIAVLGVLVLGGLLGIAIFFQRKRWQHAVRRIWDAMNPPDRIAARRLIRACQRNDARAAEAAWLSWQNLQTAEYRIPPALSAAATELQRALYGATTDRAWQGDALRRTFLQAAGKTGEPLSLKSPLPTLNPVCNAKVDQNFK